MSEQETAAVIDRLYRAFLGGDAEGMLATFADDIDVRFLAQYRGRGVEPARDFFNHAGGLLTDLDFRIRRTIIDGNRAAVLWDETATTADGQPWENHGVDVYEVANGRIVSLHENNDARLVHAHLPRYEPPGQTAGE